MRDSKFAKEQAIINEIEDFYKVTLHLSALRKLILIMEEEIWKNERILPSLLRGGVFIVVGTWEGSELFDRLVAYKIADALEKRNVDSLVMTDKYWWESRDKYGYEKSPIISVGGPVSNSLSGKIAEMFKLERYKINVGIGEVNGQLLCYIWGPDAKGTLKAGRIFIERHLDNFIDKLRKSQ